MAKVFLLTHMRILEKACAISPKQSTPWQPMSIGYDVLVAQKMVVTESALAEMVSLLL